MKKKSHEGLAQLVGTHGTIPLKQPLLNELIVASTEPDKMNKQRIMENIMNTLTIPVEWLINHTIRAKTLAKRCVWEAYQARKKNDPSWIRYLGWTYHYTADWGTPHHAPLSKSNPVPKLTGLGAIIGGIIGGISKAGNDLGDVLKGIAKGALVGAGITGVAGLAGLAIEHSRFEETCDDRWEENPQLIREKFIERKVKWKPTGEIGRDLELFEEKMNSLRDGINNLPANWIWKCNNSEFADYMVKIALIMDLAYQIVMR